MINPYKNILKFYQQINTKLRRFQIRYRMSESVMGPSRYLVVSVLKKYQIFRFYFRFFLVNFLCIALYKLFFYVNA